MGDAESVTVLVADDEALARRRLTQLLRGDPDVRLVGECPTGSSALDAVRELTPDILFLDVQMPGLGGFEVLARLRPHERPVVVFSTAYDAYAVAAFEVNAVDYLLKPFTDERFQEALGRAKQVLRSERLGDLQLRLRRLLANVADPMEPLESGAETGSAYLERLAVRSGDGATIIEAAQVDWIEADGDYVTLHVGTRSHLVRATMGSLEARLDPRHFLRIHRSVIVRIDRIRRLQVGERGDYKAVLDKGERLSVGPSHRNALLGRLGLPTR